MFNEAISSTLSRWTYFALIAAALLVLVSYTVPVYGEEFSLVPRVSTGVLFYDFKLDNTFVVVPTAVGGFATSGTEGIDVSDNLYFIGGGLSAKYGRFFIDLNGLKSTDGSSNTPSQSTGVTNQPVDSGIGSGTSTSRGGKADFDRYEITALAGYDITDSLRIFAGYKYAETKFNIEALQAFDVAVSSAEGSASLQTSGPLKTRSKFVQKGPFVGAGYSVPVDVFQGSVLLNTALSYLNGDISQKLRYEATDVTVEIDGSPVPFELAPLSTRSKLDGNALGINAGIGWAGRIPTTRVGYLIGADGSFYDFEADQSDSDFREVVWRIRGEVSYRF